ncbi:hypothetical protein F6X34_20040 [Dickeya dianthicola]|uniref:hypothetical protein n=1 Tax=Dickeya dianthicola TaxID=204039 RepID=UPI000686FAE6|nr:hypothetical protein [Dickeya dianthicola]MZG45135.1 hypothetical protein [Dickeya dianthicola]
MQNTVQDKAYQRGLKAASIWKSTKSRLKQWDAACVDIASRYNMPKLVGHVPIAAFCVLSVAAILFGGFIISSIFLLLWAVFLISPKKGLADGAPVHVTNYQPNSYDSYDSNEHGSYRENPNKYYRDSDD